MPLTRDLTGKIARHDTQRAIGLWMTVVGSKPEKPVRVFVTYEPYRNLIQPTSAACTALYKISTTFVRR